MRRRIETTISQLTEQFHVSRNIGGRVLLCDDERAVAASRTPSTLICAW